MKNETGNFNWRKLSQEEKTTLVRESGLPDAVAFKEVGMISAEEMSKLKNSVRLHRITNSGKF